MGVQYLYDIINPDQLELPPFIMEYDVQVCVAYFVSPHFY